MPTPNQVQEAFRSVDIELPPANAGCGQNCAGAQACAAIQMKRMKIVRAGRGFDAIDNHWRYHLGAELQHL